MSTNQKMTHELIARAAKEFAGAWYEEAAHDNEFYAFYPKQQEFIRREWKRFVEIAKQQLTLMLNNEMVPEWQKEQIFEALLKHASLPGNIDPRVASKIINEGDAPNLVNIMPNNFGVH